MIIRTHKAQSVLQRPDDYREKGGKKKEEVVREANNTNRQRVMRKNWQADRDIEGYEEE